MTSLNAPGFSFSVLNVSAVQQMLRAYTPPGATQLAPVNITDLLDDSTDALAWIGVRSNWPTKGKDRLSRLTASPTGEATLSSHTDIVSKWNLTDMSPEMVKGGVVSACEAVLGVEKDLTEYDTVLGDGDCGETFSAGAKGNIIYRTVNYWLTFAPAVLTALENGRIGLGERSLGEVVRQIADVLEDSMGGTIGACKQSYNEYR